MNKITIVTRQKIADKISQNKISISGRLDDADFLDQIFDLKSLPSNDHRFRNAWSDIKNDCHWGDNQPGWMFYDARFNLLNCSDDIFIKILSTSIHPTIYNSITDVMELIAIYNTALKEDGFEVYISNNISNLPVYSIREIIPFMQLEHNKEIIKKYLNTDYIRLKIKTMEDALSFNNEELAIGTAKELLETVCISILKEETSTTKKWNLLHLSKETFKKVISSNILDSDIENPELAKKSSLQILNGLNTTIHGIAELRNSYGTGHGKNINFKNLPKSYAYFITSIISDIVIFILTLNGEKSELIE